MSEGSERARAGPLTRRQRRHGVCAIALLAAAGCRTWRPVPATPDTARAAPLAHARVVKRDSSAIVLSAVQVRGDSVVGFVGRERAPRAIARDDVARIETRQVSAARTSLGIVGGAVLLYALLGAIAVGSYYSGM